MNGHPSPRDLIASCSHRLPAQKNAEIEAHVAHCSDCAQRLEDLRVMETLLASSFQTEMTAEGDSPEEDPDLDRALDRIIRRTLEKPHAAPGAAQQPGRRTLLLDRALRVATAAAAVALVVTVLRLDSPTDQATFSGKALITEGESGFRGHVERTLHFELDFSRATHLLVVQVTRTSVDIVYPDPNPLLAPPEGPTRFRAGRGVRIPSTPLADPPAPPPDQEPVYWAVPVDSLPGFAERESLVSELRQLPKDPHAVRDTLTRRFGIALSLPVH